MPISSHETLNVLDERYQTLVVFQESQQRERAISRLKSAASHRAPSISNSGSRKTSINAGGSVPMMDPPAFPTARNLMVEKKRYA